VRRVLSGAGKVLITLGLLILLFVSYQLWGTGIYTARQQHRLESSFQKALQASGSPSGSTTTTRPGTTPATVSAVTTAPPAPPSAPEGGAVGHIVIPKIGVDAYVVQGTNDSDLRKGPGHYPSTPYPGQRGNAGIAGHRTTYGAPFGDLDQLETGDSIEVTTLQGTFNYKVYTSVVVDPSDFKVLDTDPARPATLTLTTCNPKYSASQRLIVKADLVIPPGSQPLASSLDPNDPVVKQAATSDAFAGHSGSKLPTFLAGLLTLLIGALWWLLFHRHPRWTTWFLGVVPFAISLSIFYYLLERVLPSNY
jgi:sortase A